MHRDSFIEEAALGSNKAHMYNYAHGSHAPAVVQAQLTACMHCI